MSARRLLILIKGLANDPTSTFYLNITEGWGRTNQLLAAIADASNFMNYMFARVNTPKDKESPVALPDQIPRPGVTPRPVRENTVHQGHTTLSREEVEAKLAMFNPPTEGVE